MLCFNSLNFFYLVPTRQELHNRLFLPLNRPIFRIENSVNLSFSVQSKESNNGML